MTSHLLTFHESDLLQKSHGSPLRRGFETAAGPLFLQSFCPPALVASRKAERGLHAFAHFPEREHQLLLGIAERPDCSLTLAYTPGGGAPCCLEASRMGCGSRRHVWRAGSRRGRW